MSFRISKTGVCAAAFAVAFINVSPAAVTWPMELLKTAPQTYDASKYATNTGVQVTFFDGLPFKGKPTRVFAYYGIPKHKPGEKVPAMTDEQGNRLSCANTIWSLIDTDSGRPIKPTEEMIAPYTLEEKLDMEYAPRRIAIPSDVRQAEPVIIRPHHLDTNHHVNNGQYVRIALDCLGKECRIRQLRAEYKKQSYLNDVLTPYISSSEEGIHVIALKDKDDTVSCVVEIMEQTEK